MSATGLEVFDTTLNKTNRWLNDAMQELHSQNRHMAYLALRSTLHAVRDRLPVDEVAHLAAELPMLVRGFYYEGWDPSGKPEKWRRRDEFLERITESFRGAGSIDPEAVARAMFALLSSHLSPGEAQDVKQALPEEVRTYWPN
jgi:uncharacterized protein (DUF2267 family)